MTAIYIVADDYGIAPGVNRAIRDLISHKRINATSSMVVAPAFDETEAKLLAQASPSAALGLHLTLTAPFKPLTRGYPAPNGFPTLGRTALLAFTRRLNARALRDEISAQIAAFTAAFGRTPDFIDGHQHVHLFPGVNEALLAVMKESTPQAWARQCQRAGGRLSLSDRKAVVLDCLSKRFRARAAAAGIRTNPAFAGAYDFESGGGYSARFAAFVSGLPDRSVVMCHPGMVDDVLLSLDPLTTPREREYTFFNSDAFSALMQSRDIKLI